MESRQLRYFVAVARECNITRAAEKLRIAQPPLSRQIQQLEDTVGAALFDRASRPLALTEAGRLLFEQAVLVLDRIDETEAMMRRLTDSRQARLVIGFVGSTLYGYLPEMVRAYRAARPKVEVSLIELTTMEQVTALKEGRIDIGFGRVAFDDPALERTVMRNERLCVALPRTHRLASTSAPITLTDLTDDVLIVYPRAPRPSYADTVLNLFRTYSLHPSALQEVREVQTALGLVAAEVGISVVPVSVERVHLDNVVFVPLAEKHAVSPILMNRRRGDRSVESAFLLKLIEEIYRKKGISRGLETPD